MDTVELLKRFKKEKEGFEGIYICLHSFGGSAEAAKQIQKSELTFYFEMNETMRLTWFNASRPRQRLLLVLDHHLGEIPKLSQVVAEYRARSIIARERFL